MTNRLENLQQLCMIKVFVDHAILNTCLRLWLQNKLKGLWSKI